MGFNESFEAAKNFAVNAAQTAAQKAKVLAAIAKTNVSIYAEEDKIKKAEAQLGKLYYRDYAVGEEMDSAEYLPWCHKIDESNALIAELRDRIEQLRASEEPEAEEAAEEPAEESEPAGKETGCGCCCGTAEDAPAEETCCCTKPEEAPAEETCCCEKPEQTPAEPEDTAIEIHIAGQKDGSAE